MPTMSLSPDTFFLQQIWQAVGGAPAALERVRFLGEGALASVFEVTPLAAASMAAAGLAAATLEQVLHGLDTPPVVTVDRRLASMWFALSVRPQGWALPPAWDAVAGDYRCADGWIRLHTNAPAHRAAALAVLGVPPKRAAVTQAVRAWPAEALESAVVAQGGCAAALRSASQWQAHAQGRAVRATPLLEQQPGLPAAAPGWQPVRGRPLQGLRVLDLTRILAGPVATRLLAALGAEVLRIDPPGWDEPSLAPEVTVGKRCARLDLKSPEGQARFQALLQGADVLVHGYRSDALEALGLGAAQRQAWRPGLVDVALDAYGFTGPWARRRGFDSLVQMSIGVADAGRRSQGDDTAPVPLPVQALDHATGYLLACAALRGLTQRLQHGQGSLWRASLARTGQLLQEYPSPSPTSPPAPALAPETEADLLPTREATAWGPARRLRPALSIDGLVLQHALPAGPLGSSPARWHDGG